MTRIKICGITNIEDARAAVDYGADALGFILVEESPRYCGRGGVAARIARDLPPFVSRVAVYKDLGVFYDRWDRSFDAVQYYENSLRSRPASWKKVIRAVRVQCEASLAEIEADGADDDALLLDAYHPGKLGGSGETFNWALAVEAKRRFGKPIILAGGLTPENVEEAIASVQPYAVDVSSGVEAEPGRKDHARLRAFIRAVRKADMVTG